MSNIKLKDHKENLVGKSTFSPCFLVAFKTKIKVECWNSHGNRTMKKYILNYIDKIKSLSQTTTSNKAINSHTYHGFV